ncbi:ABC transporter substrate-binding protein [Limobrevibacterium gyesilva]|uniref:ABC transporter substrate-binding protein n=1 Tax=Limobrevibacterium gyesilva TaxID=2991712 RepID=A0AA42CGX7_9PROT|nr:ABC transporter substrate-binding protein [Limobrevibacterium gyesilva]MCW3476581.1 ABC transporter substrate-binding protein [Limobrevibacterium gyesilva]
MIRRRDLMRAGGGLAFAGLAAPAIAQPATTRTLRVIPQSNLTSIDPIWTTAVVTRNHAYLVYDQLVAVNRAFEPKPQMAEGWTVEDDGRTWTFTLRAGLRFHDGEPVRARDCVASIRRWWARDSLGQTVASLTDELSAPTDATIRFRLKRAFPLLALALGKPSPMPLFIMPERVASTDPFKQITDATGSGPFRFLREEWNPGSSAAWAKFDGYVPRSEPVDGISGGKIAGVDRIVWTVIPDSATAAAAMMSGEQDYWEYPLHDLVPLLKSSRDVVVGQRLSQGIYAGARINHLQPPFNNVKVRQALLMAIDQRDHLRAVVGDEGEGTAWGACESVYTCGTTYATDAGNALLRTHSVEKAAAALKASGYNGERTVLLAPSDYPQINALSLVTADLMRRMGFNLDLASVDWGTLVQRRASKEPVEKGGWSVFHSTWSGTDVQNPGIQQQTRANRDGAWFGWPDDPELERMRNEWLVAADPAEQKRIATAIQVRSFETVPFVPLGYYQQPSAWRKNVTGTFPCQVTSFWNIGKSA